MKLLWTMGCGQSTKSQPTEEVQKSTHATQESHESHESHSHHETTSVRSLRKKSQISNSSSGDSLDHTAHGHFPNIHATPGHAVSQNGEVNIDGLKPPSTPPNPTESLISKVPIRRDNASSGVPMPTMAVKTESQIEFFRMLDAKIEQGPEYIPGAAKT